VFEQNNNSLCTRPQISVLFAATVALLVLLFPQSCGGVQSRLREVPTTPAMGVVVVMVMAMVMVTLMTTMMMMMMVMVMAVLMIMIMTMMVVMMVMMMTMMMMIHDDDS
jgi:hypothetical protein